jgi:hypothetical protein
VADPSDDGEEERGDPDERLAAAVGVHGDLPFSNAD